MLAVLGSGGDGALADGELAQHLLFDFTGLVRDGLTVLPFLRGALC